MARFQTSESVDKIGTAISALQAEAGVVPMSGTNQYDRYKYAKLDDYVKTIAPLLGKHKISVVTSVEHVGETTMRQTKSGGSEFHVTVTLVMRAMCGGEWIECVCVGEGQDRGDKATYKAITGARKYGLACLFGLATGDDAEDDSPEEARSAGARPAAPAVHHPRPQTAPTVVPAPASESAHPDFALGAPDSDTSTAGLVASCRAVKSGKNAKGDWSLYKIILVGDSREYFTFSKTFSAVANVAFDKEQAVSLTFETKPGKNGETFREVQSLEPIVRDLARE
jgi:hypothetical protein